MKRRILTYLKSGLILILMTNCVALKKLPEKAIIKVPSKSEIIKTYFENFSIDLEKNEDLLYLKHISDKHTIVKYHYDEIEYPYFLVSNLRVTKEWISLFDNYQDAKNCWPEGKHCNKKNSYLGDITGYKSKYNDPEEHQIIIKEIAYNSGKKQVLKVLIPFEAAPRTAKMIGLINEAREKGLNYVECYAITYSDTYGITKLINSSTINKKVIKDVSSREIENTEQVYHRIDSYKILCKELNYSKTVSDFNQERLRIEIAEIFKNLEGGKLNKNYKLDILVTSIVNNNPVTSSITTTINPSVFIKPDIVYTKYEIIDETDFLTKSPGIGNGLFDAGEEITLNFYLKNISDDYYISSSAFLSSQDEYIKVQSGNIRFDEIYPGVEKKSPISFKVQVSPSTPHGYRTNISIRIEDSGHEKTNFTEIPITILNVGPVVFEKAIVDDDDIGGSRGNGDGIFESGEVIEFIVFIKNDGVVDLNNVKVTLTPSGNSLNYIEMIESSHTYPTVKSKMDRSIPADYDFKIKNNVGRNPIKLSFNLQVTGQAIDTNSNMINNNFEYNWESDFELMINTKDAKVTKLQKH